jgi:hypothetical protein
MKFFNKLLLRDEVQSYLTLNQEVNIREFALRKSPFLGISSKELSEQAQGKQIVNKKFTFLNKKNIIFPKHLNLEQASSEQTAKYKSTLFSGNKGIDLSLGFGIDAYFLSNNFKQYFGIEPNAELLEIVEHNYKTLDKNNISLQQNTTEQFLTTNHEFFDFIYLDPDRRKFGNKNVQLSDLSPDISKIETQLLEISPKIAIKLSPLISINELVQQLKNINFIYFIALKNELKEVLIVLERNITNNPKMVCVNLETSQKEQIFNFEDEKLIRHPNYSFPKKYLYFPNVALLKSNAFRLIAAKFNLEKLDVNTHIYTSKELINFPGNIFQVIDFNVDTKRIKKTQANLISKNYPIDVPTIKKKYQIKDGGEKFYIFTQSLGKKIILEGSKI